MHDLLPHFYASIGVVLALAAVGRLAVALELLDDRLVKGTPRPVEPEDALYGDTGAPAVIYFDDSAVQLTDVRFATLCRPSM